ncbi:hypothetical protein BH23GEM5_BH23GEM5_09220 [soil metagenome]
MQRIKARLVLTITGCLVVGVACASAIEGGRPMQRQSRPIPPLTCRPTSGYQHGGNSLTVGPNSSEVAIPVNEHRLIIPKEAVDEITTFTLQEIPGNTLRFEITAKPSLARGTYYKKPLVVRISYEHCQNNINGGRAVIYRLDSPSRSEVGTPLLPTDKVLFVPRIRAETDHLTGFIVGAG